MAEASWVQWILGAGLTISMSVTGALVKGLVRLRGDHTALSIDVAKNYVSIAHLSAVEKRIEIHLQRIEDKIDRSHGHD